jgi:hypothetical protein
MIVEHLPALRAPSEKLQGMTFNGKLRLLFNQTGQLLQWTEHQINDLATSPTLYVVMMLASVPHFIAHLPLMKSDRIHQTKLLQHGQISIDRHQVSGHMSPLQSFMNLRRRDWKSMLLKNSENGPSRLCELFPTGFEVFEN